MNVFEKEISYYIRRSRWKIVKNLQDDKLKDNKNKDDVDGREEDFSTGVTIWW